MNKQSFLSVEPSCRNHARSALCVSMLLVGACSASKGSGASAAGGGAGMPSGGSDGAGLGTGGASGGGGSTTPGIGGMGVGGNLGIGGHLGVGGASVTCMQPIPITSGTTATVTADFGALGETVESETCSAFTPRSTTRTCNCRALFRYCRTRASNRCVTPVARTATLTIGRPIPVRLARQGRDSSSDSCGGTRRIADSRPVRRRIVR